MAKAVMAFRTHTAAFPKQVNQKEYFFPFCYPADRQPEGLESDSTTS